MMKTIPGYKKTLKSAAKAAVNDFEAAMSKRWEEDDETLNDGDWEEYYDDGTDDIYND